MRLRLCRLRLAWIRLRAWPGQYLNRSRYAEVQRHKSYIGAKEQEYKDTRDREWADLRKQLKTQVGLESILGRSGVMVLVGAVITVLASGLGWNLGASQQYAVVLVVGAVMGTAFLLLRNRNAVYFSLGCAVVIYLGLSTLAVGPLGEEPLGEAIDAQKVSAMFVGVAIVLSLCEVLIQVGERGIDSSEREAIKYADRATIWSRMLGPVRGAIPRTEARWTFVAVGLFALSVVHFMLPLVQATWLGDLVQDDGGGRGVVVSTMVMLTFPLLLLMRIERAWFVGGLAVGLVGALVGGALVMGLWKPLLSTGSSPAGAIVSFYPVTGVDAVLVETGLSEEDRAVLEDVVLFGFDSATIKPPYDSVLVAKINVLKQNADVGLRLEGHTDDRGSDEVNYALGRARALAVRGVFADSGLDVGRFAYVSRGRSELRDTARSDEARKRNRRVEFVVTYDVERYVSVDTVTVMVIEADTTLGLEAGRLADTVVVIRAGGQRGGRSR